MKEKILKYGQFVVAAVLAMLMTLQEVNLGNPTTAWMMGTAVAIGFSLAIEAYHYVTGSGWQWKNMLFWLIGGAVGIGIAYMI